MERAGQSGRARRADGVALLVLVSIALGLSVMLGRVVQLQTRPSAALKAVMDDRVSSKREPGARGDLLDRRWRPLAVTHFGRRAFVDPWNFPNPPGEAFQKLAGVLGMPVEKVAERLVPAFDKNDALRADTSVARTEAGVPEGAIRYVSIGGVLEADVASAVQAAKVPGVGLEYRSVREAPGDESAASLVGLVGVDHNGLLGAEFFVDKMVTPSAGSITYVRDSRSRPLWVAPGGYVAPKRGADVRLSIDMELQSIGYEELERGIEEADAAGGRLVMMDPATGEVLAMVDIIRHIPNLGAFPWRDPKARTELRPGVRYKTIKDDERRDAHPAAGRNRCVEDVYEPGSTFKPFMWATVTELGLASPGEVFDTENGHWTPYGKRHLEDVIKRPTMTWSEVLVNSSNIGMAKGTSRLSFKQMHDAVRRFGFGSPPKIGLPGESGGLVTTLGNWSKYSQTSVAMGHEVAVTPVQMVRAFSCFARSGDMAGTMPQARLLARDARDEAADMGVRVLPARIAELTRNTMRGVTQKIDDRIAKKGEQASGPHYEWFGKSGTAEIPLGKAPKGKVRPVGSDGYFPNQYNSSFIAGAPLENPQLVVVVVIDDPGPGLIAKKEHYGSYVAGPVVRRVFERALPYLGVKGAEPPKVAPEPVARAGE
jgi:cell division protein FtsI/penicillin-binding protein 2